MGTPIDWLLQRFGKAPDVDFMIYSGKSFSYAWLVERIAFWQQRCEAENASGGKVVAVKGDFSPDCIALILSLASCGAILVPLTKSVEAQWQSFMAICETQVDISFIGETEPTFVHNDTTPKNVLIQSLQASKSPGLILFSSGSTGIHKAALHNLSFLIDKFLPTRHTFRTITFLLLDHIGGFNTLFYSLSNLGTIVALDRRDPDHVCNRIEQTRAQLLPTSPTFLNLLLISEAYRRYDLSSIERITYGTEPMPEATLRRIHALFPGVELQQTYGLSEIGILRTKSRSSDSLWLKIGGEGFETRVVDGLLQIRAHSAMLGYLNAPDAFDHQGWFNTNDAIEVDGEYIKILGRRSEIINVGGLKVYPSDVESVILQLSNVKDVTVTGELNALTGSVVVARVNLHEPEELALFRSRLRLYCRDRLESFKVPAKVEITYAAQYSERFKKMRDPQGA